MSHTASAAKVSTAASAAWATADGMAADRASAKRQKLAQRAPVRGRGSDEEAGGDLAGGLRELAGQHLPAEPRALEDVHGAERARQRGQVGERRAASERGRIDAERAEVGLEQRRARARRRVGQAQPDPVVRGEQPLLERQVEPGQRGEVHGIVSRRQRIERGQEALDGAMLAGGGVAQRAQERAPPHGVPPSVGRGRRTVHTVPRSGDDVSSTCPRCSSTRRRTMNRPSPSPDCLRARASPVARLNGS